jgi:hypothetical protein
MVPCADREAGSREHWWHIHVRGHLDIQILHTFGGLVIDCSLKWYNSPDATEVFIYTFVILLLAAFV